MRGNVIRSSLLFIAIVYTSLVLSTGIRLGYLPAGTDKSIMVEVEYHGAYAEEMERIVVCPLEESLSRQKGIIDLVSVAEEGRCRLYIRFGRTTDLDRAYLNTREAVDAVYVSLPAAVQRPLILKSDYRSFPVFIAAFPRGEAVGETELKRHFENVEGTGEIEIGGGVKREIQIAPDTDKCAASGVAVDDIVGSLRRNSSLGSFGREAELPILLDGRLESLAQVEALAVKGAVRLGDLAAVGWEDTDRESIGRVDGRERTLAYVHKAGDANTVMVCRNLRQVSRRLGGQVLYDYGLQIEMSLLEIFKLVVLGIALVTVLTFLFLGTLYPAFLVSLNIPFAILISLAVLRVLGREINIMTLSGLAIGVGLVIDAGIVFCEEFLALDGDLSRTVGNVRPAIAFSAATTLAVFFPLLFAEKTAITQFGDLALTVSVAVAASLLYVFLFLPAFLSHAYTRMRRKAVKAPGRYAGLLRKAFLRLTKLRVLPLMLLLLSCGGAAVLLPGLRLEGSLPWGGNRLVLILEYPSGIGLDSVFSGAGTLESTITSLQDVDHVVAKYQKERASFDITLGARADKEGLIAQLREMESRYRPAFFYFPEATAEDRPVEVILTGTGNRRLRELANGLSQNIALIPGVGQVVYHYKRAVPVKNVRVNLVEAGRLGLDPYAVYAFLYWMFSEPVAAKWTRGGGEADIRLVRAEPASPQSVLRMKAAGLAGKTVELKNVAVLEEGPGFDRISHYNRQRSVSFSVVTDSGSVMEVLRGIENILASSPLPFGYHAEIGRNIREQARTLHAALRTLGLAVVLIFLILVFEFECLALPLFILLQIPLAFVLPVYLLRLFSFPVSLPVIAGLILTAGVAVNNSIVILAPYGGRRLEVLPVLTILERKLRAILIASLTTVLGVFPLFFSSGRDLLPPLSLVMAAGISGSLPFFFLSLALFARRQA